MGNEVVRVTSIDITETWTGVIIVFFVAQEWDFASMQPVGQQRSFLKRNI